MLVHSWIQDFSVVAQKKQHDLLRDINMEKKKKNMENSFMYITHMIIANIIKREMV